MKQQDTRPAKRAVLYLRTRTINGDDGQVDAQLARQRAVCRRVANRHGAEVVHEYAAIGGVRDPHVRYIVSTMLGSVTRDRVDYVITTGIDRLCRGPAAADHQVLSALRESGATLLCGSTWDVPVPGRLIDDVITAARCPRIERMMARRSA